MQWNETLDQEGGKASECHEVIWLCMGLVVLGQFCETTMQAPLEGRNILESLSGAATV